MCSMMTNHTQSWLLLFCHFVMLLYYLRQWTMDSVWSTKYFRCPWSMILLILMLLQFNLLILGSVRFIAFSLWCHHSPQTKAGTVWCVGVICGDARFINHFISSNAKAYFHHANLINRVILSNDETHFHIMQIVPSAGMKIAPSAESEPLVAAQKFSCSCREVMIRTTGCNF